MRMLVAVALWGLQGAVTAGEAKKELTQLNGTWRLIKQFSRGADTPVEEGSKLVIEGTTAKAYEKGQLVQTFSIRVDPSKKPAEIDIRGPAKPGGKDRVIPGIYKLEGDS